MSQADLQNLEVAQHLLAAQVADELLPLAERNRALDYATRVRQLLEQARREAEGARA